MFNICNLVAYLNFWCGACDSKPDKFFGIMKVKLCDNKIHKFYFTSVHDLDKARDYLYKNHVDFTYSYFC